MTRSTIDDATLVTLSQWAGLELSPERRRVLAPALNGVLQQFEALDAIDVGETPPAHAFDPRWEAKS